MNTNLFVIWIVLAVLFAITEAITAQIVTIWFVLGSVAAIIACAAGANTAVQVILFAGVSLLSLVIARPIFRKKLKTKAEPTNADRYIGEKAIVLETIDNTSGTGEVKVKGIVWTARSGDGSVIEKGSAVTVIRIEGAKLIVTKQDNKKEKGE